MPCLREHWKMSAFEHVPRILDPSKLFSAPALCLFSSRAEGHMFDEDSDETAQMSHHKLAHQAAFHQHSIGLAKALH